MSTLTYAPDTSSTAVHTERLREIANRAYHANGMSDAPQRNQDEPLHIFRQRLLEPLRPFCPQWRGASADTIRALSRDELAFANVERRVYADAIHRGETYVEPGTLREHITTDETGRRIRSYTGDPAACWGQFSLPPKLVTGWLGSK